MKKIFMLSLLVAFSSSLFAQTLDEINKLVAIRQFGMAQTSVDKFLGDPKNAAKADAWYYKGFIYNALSFDSARVSSDAFTMKSTAFDAFKKYETLDPKGTMLKDEQYASYLNLYYGFYDLGAKDFGKKDFDGSLNAFKKALEVRDYANDKKFVFKETTLAAFDTSLVLNVAIAATQAKKPEEAIVYYKKLADANIAGPGYLEVYQALADYYSKGKDEANLQPLLTKARGLYPTNEFWDEVELGNIPKNAEDKSALLAKYDDLLAKNPGSYTLAYNYCVELYNSLYGNDAKLKDPAAGKERLTTVLKQAIANDKGIDATVLMTNHLYNLAADISSAASMVKGAKPEDVKKKAELKKQSNAKMDEVIPYAESALKYFAANQATLKGKDKANQKIIAGYLSEIYAIKGNKEKVAEYEKIRIGA